jgi:hypothetical protein
MMYRIVWESFTGHVGNGEYYICSHASAEEIVKNLNKKYPLIRHWYEIQPLPRLILNSNMHYCSYGMPGFSPVTCSSSEQTPLQQ